MREERVAYHACPLCEATCGLEVRVRGREVTGIRGDEADVFSRGFLCPKAYALKDLDADPDRVRTPLVRRSGPEPRAGTRPSPRSTAG
jgi:anaerobic selenocysteine-containing dehydrogenase